jgi:ribonuclease VapC
VTGARFVLDASGVLAWLFRERGHEAVDKVLPFAALSSVNLAEVLYRAAEEGMSTSTLARDLEALGVQIEPFTADDADWVRHVRQLARKAGRPLSLGDACCLATAIRLGVPVVVSDQAWEALDLPVEVHPFR